MAACEVMLCVSSCFKLIKSDLLMTVTSQVVCTMPASFTALHRYAPSSSGYTSAITSCAMLFSNVILKNLDSCGIKACKGH